MKSFLMIISTYALLQGVPLIAGQAEVSLIKGAMNNTRYDSEVIKTSSTLGGRYAQQFTEKAFWFGQTSVSNESYRGTSDYNLKDHSGFELGGGVRYYFDRYNNRIIPFASFTADYARRISSDLRSDSFIETKEAGLFYGADLGLRYSLSDRFFLDCQTNLFSSALFSTREDKKTSLDPEGNARSRASQVSRQEIFATSEKAFTQLNLSLGFRL